MTRAQKLLLAGLTLIVAISRWFALSKSQLDWDESLFAAGVRSYNVIAQNPHPPGYPLFILFAKIARVAVRGDFRSLQTVVAISSLLLFPATFFLLRELGFRFRVAIIGALITAFLPTVWYYGGTALSDVPALCGVVIASALLLAGRRDPRAWIAGMLVAGIAGGIRPLHVIIAAVPAVVGAAALRQRRAVVIGCALFVAVIAASYIGAAMATPNPPWGYLHQIGVTTRHIRTVDSMNNVTRPPLRKLAPMFFVSVQRGGRGGLALLAFAVIGLTEAVLRRRVALGIVLAMFIPIAIVSWMMLDLTAVARYGLAYVMLYSILGAHGIDVVARVAAPLVAAVIVMAMIAWTWPALDLVHNRPSPPIAAMAWIRSNTPPGGSHLYLDDALGYHAWYELAGYKMDFFHNYAEIPPNAYVAGNYCLVDRRTIQPHVLYFSFPRGRLVQIARDIYFETSIIPMNTMIRFGDGWYQDEYDESRAHAWRWMRQSSITFFPALDANGVLRLRFRLPIDALPHAPKLMIVWNGTVIEQRICTTANNERRFVLPSRTQMVNECRISLDEVARAPGDPRDLGLELDAVSWDRL